jgi:hypothetical protein
VAYNACIASQTNYAGCLKYLLWIVGTSVVSGSDGDLVGRPYPNLNFDLWVFKLDKDGQIVWKKTMGGGDADFGTALVRLPNGNIAISGSAASNGGDVTTNRGSYDVWVIVLNSRGNMLWQSTFGSVFSEYNNDIGITADGSLLVANSVTSDGGDVSGNHGRTDAWVIKFK